FTPLREGLQIARQLNDMGRRFQFTPLREGLLISKGSLVLYLRFQFTPLREGLQQKAPIFQSVFCYFLFIKYIFTKLILLK
ncbi:MAG: hypothetical protein MSA26_11550, partial [Lachnospiraceae bacterium]|nr:hypothetical protein [Lachnospiraceae bacterium]